LRLLLWIRRQELCPEKENEVGLILYQIKLEEWKKKIYRADPT
jgi:hypothetical protein